MRGDPIDATCRHWRQVDALAFGYSALTVLSSNASHVSLGVVYETGSGNFGYGPISLLWTVITDLLPRGPT